MKKIVVFIVCVLLISPMISSVARSVCLSQCEQNPTNYDSQWCRDNCGTGGEISGGTSDNSGIPDWVLYIGGTLLVVWIISKLK